MTEHSEHWYDYTRNDLNRKNPFMTHEEMLEEADRRVQENIKRAVELDSIIAKVSDEDYQKVLDAAKQGIKQYEPALQELAALEALDKLHEENGDALKQLAEIERQELINEALEELNAIVLGGQNTREFYLSISHIRNVLERLK